MTHSAGSLRSPRHSARTISAGVRNNSRKRALGFVALCRFGGGQRVRGLINRPEFALRPVLFLQSFWSIRDIRGFQRPERSTRSVSSSIKDAMNFACWSDSLLYHLHNGLNRGIFEVSGGNCWLFLLPEV
jgi:hypothetical protein